MAAETEVSARTGVAERVQPEGGVVVGDDGSACAAQAVVFAAAEAGRWGRPLHVVRAWAISTAPRPPEWKGGYVPALVEFEQATLAEERARVRQLLGPEPAVEVTVHAVHGPSAQGLISASETADLVVVGSRGRGGFTALVLGSVAEQCTRHCHCPVVVVRAR